MNSGHNSTPAQRTLIDSAVRFLAADPDVEALWLAGSLGRGGGDRWSDVDLLLLVPDGQPAAVSARHASRIAEIAEPALVNPLFGGRVLNVVTLDWRRLDLSYIERSDLPRYDSARLTTLFNRAGVEPPRAPAAKYGPSPDTLLRLVADFLRVLGLAPVVLGREEYALALSGIEHLRRMTFDLFLEENGVAPPDRGGALSRNPLLTPDQRREIDSIPPLVATRESVVAGHEAFARIFLPRAKALAHRIGMSWPTAFEDATRRHLASVGCRI